MRLNDSLHLCLLALESRYPYHTMDINSTILKTVKPEAQEWTAHRLIEHLETVSSALLQTPSYIVIDQSDAAIFLLEYSREDPAFYIHCQGPILDPFQQFVLARQTALLK